MKILTRIMVTLLFSGLALPVQGTEESVEPTSPAKALEALMGDLVRGGEWRTPNPDYKEGENAPTHYSLRYSWGPYKQHVAGELLGVFETQEGEKLVRFWSLYTFYNPVTGEAAAHQIGWNGSIGSGVIFRDGENHVNVEQRFFGIDGSLKDVRHVETMNAARDQFLSDVYEKNEEGEWTEARDWVWTRHSR